MLWDKKVAVMLVIILTALHMFKPIISREVILKEGIQFNHYSDRIDIPDVCPSYEYIVHRSSMKEFNPEKFQGVWYTFVSNDPTQPKGMSSCDRFHWKLDGHGGFTSTLNTLFSLGSFKLPISMPLEGKIIDDDGKSPGKMLEGSPKFGADLIPNNIIWIGDGGSACIRYSCKENYLGVKVFQSLQIWTREPIQHNSSKGQALLKQAHNLINFSEKHLDFIEHNDDCITKLPLIQ